VGGHAPFFPVKYAARISSPEFEMLIVGRGFLRQKMNG
jgi:hypothetical protein